MNVHAGLGEGRAKVRLPVLAMVDLLEPVESVFRVLLKICPEQADVHGMEIRIIAAADIGVGIGKFADQFAEHVREIVAIGDVRQKLGVLVALLRPVHAVHGRLVEIVAFLPPDLIKNLPPFGGRVNFHFHFGKVERALARLVRLRRRRFGVYNSERLSAPPFFLRPRRGLARGGRVQNLRAIE